MHSAPAIRCVAPASKLRENVLGVLKREGFIRGYAAEQLRPGVAQLRIELKYNEGEPVIKEINRVSKPGRRVYSKIKELPRVYAGLGISILSTPRGRDERCRGPRRQCWRRSPLPRVLRESGVCHASENIRSRIPPACRLPSPGGMVTAKGKLGELKLPLTERWKPPSTATRSA